MGSFWEALYLLELRIDDTANALDALHHFSLDGMRSRHGIALFVSHIGGLFLLDILFWALNDQHVFVDPVAAWHAHQVPNLPSQKAYTHTHALRPASEAAELCDLFQSCCFFLAFCTPEPFSESSLLYLNICVILSHFLRSTSNVPSPLYPMARILAPAVSSLLVQSHLRPRFDLVYLSTALLSLPVVALVLVYAHRANLGLQIHWESLVVLPLRPSIRPCGSSTLDRELVESEW